MSVKQHEAFCFDSFQDMLLFFDDFHGDQLQDEWDLTTVGTGAGAVVDQQTGGIYRLRAPTNATNDQATLDWNNIRTLLVSKRVAWEARVRFSSLTSFDMTMGLLFDLQNRIQFRATSSNLRLRCEDNNIETIPVTSITMDTNFHIFRIECHTHGANHVHFYYDGTETTNSPINTNVPPDYLQPWFDISTNEAVEKQLDIDYCYIREER